MTNRKVLYYLPLIAVEEPIEFANFSIKPFLKDCNYHSLLPNDIFDNMGSLIEVKGFSSGDYFCQDVDVKTFDALEGVKFGYFLTNPSIVQDYKAYISNETFECFRIIEKNQDPSFEHKVNISNGMYTFSQSMKQYYGFRKSLGLNRVEMRSADFCYTDFFVNTIADTRQFSAMKLYNRCWSTYSLHSHFDKALLARASIEALLHTTELTKKTYVNSFWENSMAHIKSHIDSSAVVSEIYSLLQPEFEMLKSNFENHISKLREARDKLVHDGQEDSEYINIPFYLVWFPLFWMVSLKSIDMSEKEAIRLILFFGLLKYDVKEWQKIDFNDFSSSGVKMTHLNIYVSKSRLLPISLENQNEESVRATVKGITKWLSDVKN